MSTYSWHVAPRSLQPPPGSKPVPAGLRKMGLDVMTGSGRIVLPILCEHEGLLVLRAATREVDRLAADSAVTLQAEVRQPTGFAAQLSFHGQQSQLQPLTQCAYDPEAPLCVRVTLGACTAVGQLDVGGSVAVAGSPNLQHAAYGSGKFSDCVIRLRDGSEVPAHRVVLATNAYFAAMWDGDSAEAAACQASFQAADADALRLVVQHIYGCSVEVPVQLLPEVWRLADMFQVTSLADAISDHLKSACLTPAALALLLPSTSQAYCAKVQRWLATQAGAHIADISACGAFLEWPASAMTQVLAARGHPMHAVVAAWKWVLHDAGARMAAWREQLLPAARLGQLVAEDLQALKQQVDEEALQSAINDVLTERQVVYERLPAGTGMAQLPRRGPDV